MSDSLRPHSLQPARLLCAWNCPGRNTGVGCHSLFQGIFSTQGLNPGLPHCRQILYHLSHQGSPKDHVCVKVSVSHVQLFATPGTAAHQPPFSWNSPGKNSAVGSHSLLQGIFHDCYLFSRSSVPGLGGPRADGDLAVSPSVILGRGQDTFSLPGAPLPSPQLDSHVRRPCSDIGLLLQAFHRLRLQGWTPFSPDPPLGTSLLPVC